MSFFHMTSESLKDVVYRRILHDVIDGVYTIDSVISEKKIAEEMHVSRAPVREALIELCVRDVLHSIPRQGYALVRYTRQNLQDILQYREILEGSCLSGCFDRITPTQVTRLQSIVEEEYIFLSKHDIWDFYNHTFNFHLALASFYENEFVYRQLTTALNTCLRIYLQLFWQKTHDILPSPPKLHLEIADCIRRRDKQGALDALQRDIHMLD